jgi:thiamine-phosphate diphosphorylase/hydroxyethylthiazole kinase
MSVKQARKLLPPDTIIGIACNTLEHVRAAVEDGVDYIGIGAVWSTLTKKLTSPVLGVRAVGAMLRELGKTDVKAVAIG